MCDQERWSSGPWAYGPGSWSSAGERGQTQGLAFLSSDAWSISHLKEQWHLLSSILVVTANHIKKKLGKNFFREASSTFIVTFTFPKSSFSQLVTCPHYYSCFSSVAGTEVCISSNWAEIHSHVVGLLCTFKAHTQSLASRWKSSCLIY